VISREDPLLSQSPQKRAAVVVASISYLGSFLSCLRSGIPDDSSASE
jgi:hypothetical protein